MVWIPIKKEAVRVSGFLPHFSHILLSIFFFLKSLPKLLLLHLQDNVSNNSPILSFLLILLLSLWQTEVLKQLSPMGRLVVCAGDGAVQSSTNLYLSLSLFLVLLSPSVWIWILLIVLYICH